MYKTKRNDITGGLIKLESLLLGAYDKKYFFSIHFETD